jgi:hypothetical protein
MDTLEQALRGLSAAPDTPALADLEDAVWARVDRLRADRATARRWRRTQVAAVSFALVLGVAFGGVEASAILRAREPALSLTDTGLAPSDLLEGRG